MIALETDRQRSDDPTATATTGFGSTTRKPVSVSQNTKPKSGNGFFLHRHDRPRSHPESVLGVEHKWRMKSGKSESHSDGS